MTGLLLSFSLPDMLPALIAGVHQAHGVQDQNLTAHQTNMWCHALTGVYPIEAHHAKRQTIRKYDFKTGARRSPYARVEAGFWAHIWWKSRTDARRKLGIVIVTDVTRVILDHCRNGDVLFTELAETGSVTTRANNGVGFSPRMDAHARADGFDRWQDMRDYFVPNPGDIFMGVRIRW